MIYLSVDVGITNLALVKAIVENFEIKSILDAKVINISQIQHCKVPRNQCRLHHSNDVFDKLEHLFQEYAHLFANIDFLLIERQPILGLVHVEQLLFGKFRSISRLVSPNAMHKWLGIGHLTYEMRKIETTRVAETFLNQCSSWISSGRLHDMADALCILLFTLHVDSVKHQSIADEKARKERMQEDCPFDENMTVDDFFEGFRFVQKQ
jgi:hypothetical protein